MTTVSVIVVGDGHRDVKGMLGIALVISGNTFRVDEYSDCSALASSEVGCSLSTCVVL